MEYVKKKTDKQLRLRMGCYGRQSLSILKTDSSQKQILKMASRLPEGELICLYESSWSLINIRYIQLILLNAYC